MSEEDGVKRESYQKAIPKCCAIQTVDEHEEHLLYCWGLISSIKNGYEMKCGDCEYNTETKEG